MTCSITQLVKIPGSGCIHIQADNPPPLWPIQSVSELRAHCLQNHIVDTHYRLLRPPQEMPTLSDEALHQLHTVLRSPIDVSETTHISHDHLILFLLGTLNSFACTFLLRGSKAAELIDPISLFCKWQRLSSDELPKPTAHDIDWFCRFDQIPPPQMIPRIKEALYRGLPKETSRLHVTIPAQSSLVKTSSPIVLSKIGLENKTDLAIGWLHTPYLFLRDAFAIHSDGTIDPSPYFWQAVTDHALGIVRLEHRHELDFYAFLAAMEHKTKDCLIVEEGTTLQKILQSFPDLSAYELDRAIKKRISDHSVEPLAFILNVLEQISQERPLLAEEVWRNCLPFIKALPSERYHPLSQWILRDSEKMSFHELHATLLIFTEAYQGHYPFAPSFPLGSAHPHSALLKQLKIKALFTLLHQHHPSPFHPYPTQALLDLINLFLTNQLATREKKELQSILCLKGDYELAPNELLQALLITPQRMKPFSIHDPLQLFEKCGHSLQLKILRTPLWQDYFVSRFSPEELISFFSAYSFKQKFSLFNEPTYQQYLQPLLLDFLISLMHKIEQLSVHSQNIFLNTLFKNLPLQPEKGLQFLSGPIFQEIQHLKGFKSTFQNHSKYLFVPFASTEAFLPLLQAFQTHQLPLPKELSEVPLPKEHVLALCASAHNETNEMLLIQCLKNYTLTEEEEKSLFPFFTQDLSLLNRLPLDPIRLIQIKLQIARLLLHKKGKEIEAIQLAAEAQHSPNIIPLEQLFLFVDELLGILSSIPLPKGDLVNSLLRLINPYFRVSEMPKREWIAKRMQLSSDMQIRACGLLWNLRIIESNGLPYNPEELIGLFDGLATLSEPQRTLFRADLSDCTLLHIEWDDERIVDRIFDLFHSAFQSHLENNDLQSAFESFVLFMNLQGNGFLKFPYITEKLMKTLMSTAADLFINDDFEPFIYLVYLVLSGFQLNGLPFPIHSVDPHHLYLDLRNFMSPTACAHRDHFTMTFLSSLFIVCKEAGRHYPRKCASFFQTYYQFFQEYLTHHPTNAAQALFHQFISWIILEEPFLSSAAVDRYAGELIRLGNQAGYFTPEELTMYELLAMQTPSTNQFSELSVINQMMVLSSSHFFDPERILLRTLNLLNFLIDKGSPSLKTISSSYLYGEIHSLALACSERNYPSLPQVFSKLNATIGLLIKHKFQIPREIILDLKHIAAKCAKSPPRKL